MTQLKTVISEDLHRKIKKIADYTATSISAVGTYLVARQIKAYYRNTKEYADEWKKINHFAANKSLNNKSLSIYTTETMRSYLESMRFGLDEKSGILLKELVRFGAVEILDKTKSKVSIKQVSKEEKIKKRVIKYSLSNCLYEKVSEIAETLGISVSALTSFIVTEYLMDHYPEFTEGTEKEGLSIWDMLDV